MCNASREALHVRGAERLEKRFSDNEGILLICLIMNEQGSIWMK